MSNSFEYWKKRGEELYKIYDKETINVLKLLKKAYLKSFGDIKTEIKAYKYDHNSYEQIAADNLLTKIEAILKALGEVEDETLTTNLMDFYTTSKVNVGKFLEDAEFRNIIKYKMTDPGRMETKIIDMSTYNNPNLRAVELVVKEKFLGHNYSDRIWNNKAKLSATLKDSLTEGLIRGEGVNKIANRINKQMGVGYYNCERLVRTEMQRVMQKATLDKYSEEGIEEFKIMIAHDKRVCDKCKAMDGKVFKVADAKPGVNYCFHPNDRCTLIPVRNNNFKTWLENRQN